MADYDTPLSDDLSNGIKRLDLLAIAKRMECADGIRVILAGKMTANGLGELRREVDDARRRRKPMYMDLQEVTLLDRISAEFLNSLVGPLVHFENCPAYLQRWLSGNHLSRSV
jgi:hypothetical protein